MRTPGGFRVYVVKPRREKDGTRWQMVAKPPAGSRAKPKRRSAKTADRAEADARARAWEALLNGIIAPVGPHSTVVEVLDKHLATRETDGTNVSTVTTYRTAFNRVRPLLGDIGVAQFGGPSIAKVRDQLVAKGLDGKTVNVTISRVRTAWNWAKELGHITAPWPAVRAAKAVKTEKRPMRPREVGAFLRWAAGYLGGRWLPFFSCAVDTGARSGDVAAIDGRHVDRKRRRVWVRDKKRKTERWSGVTARTMALLPEVGPNEPLFSTPNGRVATNTILFAFRIGIEALGIPDGDRLDVHSLRRTNCKEADRAGVPQGLAMKQTGHESPDVHSGYRRDPDDDEDMGAVAEQIATRWTPYLDPSPNPSPEPAQVVSGQGDQWFRTDSQGPLESHTGQGTTHDTPDRPVARRRASSRRKATASVQGVTPLLDGKFRDPFAAEYGEIADKHFDAMWALLHDPVRQINMRASMADLARGRKKRNAKAKRARRTS